MFGECGKQADRIRGIERDVQDLKRCVEAQAQVIGELHRAFNSLFDVFAATHGYVAKTTFAPGAVLSGYQWPVSPRTFETTTDTRLTTTIPEGHPK